MEWVDDIWEWFSSRNMSCYSASSFRGKEVMSRDIIGSVTGRKTRCAYWSRTVNNDVFPVGSLLSRQSMVERIHLNPEVEEEKL